VKKSETKDQKLLQSVLRAAHILNLFVEEVKPLGITEIAQRLNLPKTTVQGFVNTLLSVYYLEKDPITGKYRLGPAVFQLGMRYATSMDLVNISRVWLERLSFQLRIPVNIGMLVGEKVVVLMRVEPENNFMSFPPAGTVIPAHSSSIGKLLLAFSSKKRTEELLKDYDFQAISIHSITTQEELYRELETVRKERISFDREENMIGLSGIGAPVFDHRGEIIAAFAVSGSTEEIHKNKEQIIQSVSHTSNSISRQLGWDGNLKLESLQ